MGIVVAENEPELALELANLIEKISNESIQENGKFFVGVSGGSLVKFLGDGLPNIQTDFSKWSIFFCDERVVPEDDPDSTFGVYKQGVMAKVSLKEEQFVKIKQGVAADEAAKDYVQQMARRFGGKLPRFDLLLLGMGPDGHTCSLFPGHKLLQEKTLWVAPITDSPKPPPARITLTFPVINNAKHCVFALAGEGKADMVKRVLVDKEELPVNMVKPTSGFVIWIVDRAAAKHLHQHS